MKQFIVALALLALAGCTNQHLGKSTGPIFVLNSGQWTPSPADMDVGDDQ